MKAAHEMKVFVWKLLALQGCKSVQVAPVGEHDIAECDKWIWIHSSINLGVALSQSSFIWRGNKVAAWLYHHSGFLDT